MATPLLGFVTRCVRSVVLVGPLVLAAGCETEEDDGDDGSACVERDPDACTPLYEPTWERVFTQTIQPSCGAAGSACHASANASGASGGFIVGDMSSTHSMLIDFGFVAPGDASCSDLQYRLDVDDTSVLMPPGSQPLDEGERCAVAQWIAAGAQP